MADQGLDPSLPACLHLVSAFLAMEPSDSLISYARVCGCGTITKQAQKFIWDHCLTRDAEFYAPYLKNFLKKLIAEAESNYGCALDDLYELYAQYITSSKDTDLVKRDARVCKRISFLFPDGNLCYSGCSQLRSYLHSRVLVFQLQCSLNMLEGDTGCSIWPSSLFLSELILSYPELYSNKSCFEIGSGVGLVGICLAHVKASEVILSDGDLSTLANMKFNLELNHLNVEVDKPERNVDSSMVKCLHLPWESASENQLQGIMPDIVLGADVIYDPVYLPHLVRLLTILLNRKKSCSLREKNASCKGLSPRSTHEDCELGGTNQQNFEDANSRSNEDKTASNAWLREDPVAYIACVIRNIDTFDYFLSLVDQANLHIADLTDSLKPVNLLPYMQSYDQASIKLVRITSTRTNRLV